MSEEKLRVDIEAIREELEKLRGGLETFQDFTKNLYQEDVEALDAMNSDFLERLKLVFESAKDRTLSGLAEDLEDYIEWVEDVITNFEEKGDQAMAGQIGGNNG